ncbi:hypothetical protein BS47DRAFT_1365775 [Hydnum rufescens UP504]|uniref:Uncharacterized protein n=1 Tax=Hydnum rufescens UP504 TaxID=1448309 RepID=A0A9P6DRR4_9AGAM|nr:hypothetical protein BS47DRAFT_1365775 [Hydnum rufescens UP504]
MAFVQKEDIEPSCNFVGQSSSMFKDTSDLIYSLDDPNDFGSQSVGREGHNNSFSHESVWRVMEEYDWESDSYFNSALYQRLLFFGTLKVCNEKVKIKPALDLCKKTLLGLAVARAVYLLEGLRAYANGIKERICPSTGGAGGAGEVESKKLEANPGCKIQEEFLGLEWAKNIGGDWLGPIITVVVGKVLFGELGSPTGAIAIAIKSQILDYLSNWDRRGVGKNI